MERRGRSERRAVSVINPAWVNLNCHLEERDWGILKTVEEWRLLRSDQVKELCPGFANLAKDQDLCNRRLRVLFDCYVINKASPRLAQGTSKQYIWVDRAGYILLGKPVRYRKELPQDYLHTTGIVDAYLLIRRATGLQVIKVWHEHPAKTAQLIPDMILVLRAGTKGFVFFVEIDRGLTRESQELKKIQKYVDWMNSERWRQEPWAREYSIPRFPPLVYLMDDGKRAKLFSETARKQGLAFHHGPLDQAGEFFAQLCGITTCDTKGNMIQ